jgi:histidinol dehydrogenase
LEEAFELLNEAAPEHAQLSLRDAWEHLSRVRNAGAIFVGEYSTVPLGDYLAGPSHVLPTATTARFASALNAEDFVKRSSIVAISKSATADLAPDLAILARAENLPAHARAVEVRVPEERSGEPRAHGR